MKKKINIFFQTYFVTLFYKLVGLKEIFFYAALRIHYLNVKKKEIFGNHTNLFQYYVEYTGLRKEISFENNNIFFLKPIL